MARVRRKKRPTEPAEPESLRAAVADHLEWMRVTNYSERTVEGRQTHLGYFVAWCEARGVVHPAEVTRPVLERYRRWLYHYRRKNGRPLSTRSQHSRLVPVRALFRWLARQNLILYNPASELELPKLERRLPKYVLTAPEAELVLGQPDVTTPLGLRDRALLEVLYSTGMRRAELIGLKMHDLDLDRGTVMIRQGKGKKDRMVPVGARALAWVDRYLTEVRPELAGRADDDTLFLSGLGEPIARGRMTQIARGYVNASGVGKKGACHLFRHTMATLMLEGGADIRFIQQMLGHAELSTTQIYTQVSIRKLKEVHTSTHPAARLDRGSPEIVEEEHDDTL